MNQSDDRTFIAASNVVSSTLDGGAALLDLTSATYYALNGVGAFVWAQLSQPRTLEQLQALVCERYAVEPSRSDADVARLVFELRQAKLVVSTADAVHAAA